MMIYFPNAKINLGLHITGKREDGYHNIETVFYPVGLTDIIELVPFTGEPSEKPVFKCTGNRIDAGFSDNLCVRAFRELEKKKPIPGVRIHLHKIIPSGAGLGGGSSDASFVLKALNELFKLDLQLPELAEIALMIGSDCPFFIYNKPLLGKDRGDVFRPVEVHLSGLFIVIVHPGVSVESGWAYSRISLRKHDTGIDNIISADPREWKGVLVNDFEQVVFETYPVIRNIKDRLYAMGAIYASMTGSGSSVYGIFSAIPGMEPLNEEFPGMFIWSGKL